MGRNERTILDRITDRRISCAVMDAMDKFPKRLRLARVSRGITQKELSEAVGMKACNISGYERGYAYPDMARLAALAAYFDVSVDWLMGNGNEK